MKQLFLHKFQQNYKTLDPVTRQPQFLYTSFQLTKFPLPYTLINPGVFLNDPKNDEIRVNINQNVDGEKMTNQNKNSGTFVLKQALGFNEVKKITIKTTEHISGSLYPIFVFDLKSGFENVQSLCFLNCGSKQFIILDDQGAPNITQLKFEMCGINPQSPISETVHIQDKPGLFRNVRNLSFKDTGTGNIFRINFEKAFGNVENLYLIRCGSQSCIFSNTLGFQKAKNIKIKDCPIDDGGYLKIHDVRMFNSVENLFIDTRYYPKERPPERSKMIIKDEVNILPPEKIEILLSAILNGKRNGNPLIILRCPQPTEKIQYLAQELIREKKASLTFLP